MTLFIGPIGDNGGPAIKNKLLLKYLDPDNDFVRLNTYNRKITNYFKLMLKLVWSSEDQIVISVSRNGRRLLYPIISVKKFFFKKLKYSTICIGSGIYEEYKSHPILINKAINSSDLVTVETKTLKKMMEEDFKLKNIHYLPNYLDFSEQNISEFKDSEFSVRSIQNIRFVYLSSIRNIKGVKTMVNSFIKISKKFPNIVLDIYGPIRPDFDKEIFNNLPTNSNIKYKGKVKNREVIDTLGQYDIFVFPSEAESEGFPAVLVEAFAAGLPVIASNISFNPEIITNNVNGWIFKAGEEEELVKLVNKVLNNISTIDKIKKENYTKARLFDAKFVINKYRDELSRKGWVF